MTQEEYYNRVKELTSDVIEITSIENEKITDEDGINDYIAYRIYFTDQNNNLRFFDADNNDTLWHLYNLFKLDESDVLSNEFNKCCKNEFLKELNKYFKTEWYYESVLDYVNNES